MEVSFLLGGLMRKEIQGKPVCSSTRVCKRWPTEIRLTDVVWFSPWQFAFCTAVRGFEPIHRLGFLDQVASSMLERGGLLCLANLRSSSSPLCLTCRSATSLKRYIWAI